MLVLKEIKHQNYSLEDISQFVNGKAARLKAQFSQRSKQWKIAT